MAWLALISSSILERIAWVCRILFQPKGKEPLRGPGYGGLSLPRNSMFPSVR